MSMIFPQFTILFSVAPCDGYSQTSGWVLDVERWEKKMRWWRIFLAYYTLHFMLANSWLLLVDGVQAGEGRGTIILLLQLLYCHSYILANTLIKTYLVKRLPGVKSHQLKKKSQTRSKWMMDGVPDQFKKSQRRGYVVQCWTIVPLSNVSVAMNAWAMPEPVPEASNPYNL